MSAPDSPANVWENRANFPFSYELSHSSRYSLLHYSSGLTSAFFFERDRFFFFERDRFFFDRFY